MNAPAAPLPAPGSLGAWFLALRPRTLTAALAPVAVGAALCARTVSGVRWGAVLAALAGALLLQIGANFANDVFDFEKGADTETRLGPVRVTQAGLLSPAQMRRGMAAAFALATLCGVYLVFVAGWPIVAIGVASVLSAMAYTGGPYPLGYHGLGDVFVFVFFGLVAVTGTCLVGVGHVPPLAWWGGSAVGALATCVLVVNNVRDAETDVHAGKRTLVVRFGRSFGIAEFVALLLVAYLIPVWLVWQHGLSRWVLATLLTIPQAAALVHALITKRGAPLNPVLGATARLVLVWSLLFTAGVWP